MRFIANVSYDGSQYHGFQKLNGVKTIQEELEKALTKINKNPVEVKGAGRTDRGVHAIGQMIHCDMDISIGEESLRVAVNSMIDDSIYINYCEIVDDDFHARFNASEKTYEYVFNLGEYDPFVNKYMYNYNRDLNVKKMKIASKFLLGLNSYKAFVTGVRDNYDSVIYKIELERKKDILVIRFVGNTFYNHMVRNLVGALILVGEGKANPEDLKQMIIKEENLFNYATAPASGLYLVSIKY
jgi:tRNA pseudouridine38-40 synthase